MDLVIKSGEATLTYNLDSTITVTLKHVDPVILMESLAVVGPKRDNLLVELAANILTSVIRTGGAGRIPYFENEALQRCAEGILDLREQLEEAKQRCKGCKN